VIGVNYDSNNFVHAFIYSNGTSISIEPAGAIQSELDTINSSGQVVGESFDGSHWRAFLYTNGNFISIDPAGAVDSYAYLITDDGLIAGDYSDGDGQWHAFTASPFVADSTPPASTINQSLLNDTGVSQADLVTSDGHVTISGLASEQVSSVQIWNALTNTQVGTATIAADGESWSYSGNLAEGSYQLYAKLTDLAGNPGQTDSQGIIVVDQTASTSTITQALLNDTGGIHTDRITSDGHVSVSGTASEQVSSVQIWNALTNIQVGTGSIAADGKTWSFSGNLVQGSYQLYAKLTDLAGDPGQTASQATIVVDQTKPMPVMVDAIWNSATNVTTLKGTSEANSSVSVFDGTKLKWHRDRCCEWYLEFAGGRDWQRRPQLHRDIN
jgi:probable HAF family extracellular repeat protein